MLSPPTSAAEAVAPLRVLVVDDALIYRRVISDCLAEIAGLEVIGAASNGKTALEKIERLRPDLVTLDLEMPVLDGLAVLERLRQMPHPPEVLILSGKTIREARATTGALQLGAFDFVTKPQGDNGQESREKLQTSLARRVYALLRARNRQRAPQVTPPPTPRADVARAKRDEPPRPASVPFPPRHVEAIAIGASTGGPPALTELLSALPADLPVPLFIVQHMPALFTRSLAEDLDRHSPLTVCEAHDGQRIEPGHAYLAPGGRQMKVVCEVERLLRITDDPPENSCKPSVDYLFRSVAEVYGSRAFGVVMTGMGYDGTVGCRLLKGRGAGVICQDEATCVVYGMPREPIEQGLADRIVPLPELAATLCRCLWESRNS